MTMGEIILKSKCSKALSSTFPSPLTAVLPRSSIYAEPVHIGDIPVTVMLLTGLYRLCAVIRVVLIANIAKGEMMAVIG